MYSFDYVRPASVADAAKALAANPEARLLAGGQTLIPTLKQRLASPAAVIDIGGIADLRTIKRDGDKLVIGALVTHDAVARSAEVKAAIPALAVLADGIGDPQVRNAGTIGGSVANNDPAADYPVGGAGAQCDHRHQQAPDRGRRVFHRHVLDRARRRRDHHRVCSFRCPSAPATQKFAQPASRYALVGVFVAETAAGVRCAVTGAAPMACSARARSRRH